MCTTILLHRYLDDWPVVAVALRDEFLDRPAKPPAWQLPHIHGFCGVDLRAGGTWFGVNPSGLLVALTNRSGGVPDPTKRSRGELCTRLLVEKGAPEARRALERVDVEAYNPFHMLVSDGKDAWVATHSGTRDLALVSLNPGIHVITNWPDGVSNKAHAVQQRLREVLLPTFGLDVAIGALETIARTHVQGGSPYASPCCHAPGYGTRSCSIVALDAHLAQCRWQHTEGAPCSTRFVDLSVEFQRGFGNRKPPQ